jgi:RNA polymerase sigma-70 factor (ECF subfamily)
MKVMMMDKTLFWQMMEMEHEKARIYCGRLTGDFASGDDLYQDSVIRAFNGFAGLKSINSFKPWLYKIINNTYKNKFRSSWWKRISHKTNEIDDNLIQHNPANLYEAKRRLEYAFTALSADDRIIVTLVELEGWKIAELAELIATTEGRIKMRLSRARKKMREKLGRFYQINIKQLTNEGMADICYVTKPEKD